MNLHLYLVFFLVKAHLNHTVISNLTAAVIWFLALWLFSIALYNICNITLALCLKRIALGPKHKVPRVWIRHFALALFLPLFLTLCHFSSLSFLLHWCCCCPSLFICLRHLGSVLLIRLTPSVSPENRLAAGWNASFPNWSHGVKQRSLKTLLAGELTQRFDSRWD